MEIVVNPSPDLRKKSIIKVTTVRNDKSVYLTVRLLLCKAILCWLMASYNLYL
jgi:hypothetical protein